MTDIPNTEYITINKDGIFVGGKTGALIVYGGIAIHCSSSITEIFNDIQETVNIDFKEVNIGAFDTPGKFAEHGEPSGKPGKYTWCRIKGKDSWVCFDDNYTPDSPAACMLAIYLGGDITADNAFKKFRSAVFKQKPLTPITPVVVAANNNAQNKR